MAKKKVKRTGARKRARPLKVGESKITTNKIRGQNRKVRVTRVSKTKYKRKLVTKKKKGRRSRLSIKQDRARKSQQPWEKAYRKRKRKAAAKKRKTGTRRKVKRKARR